MFSWNLRKGEKMQKQTLTSGPVNNEVEFCKVSDLEIKEKVERILLENRISYCCQFENRGLRRLFGSGKKIICTFRIHDSEVKRATELVGPVLPKEE